MRGFIWITFFNECDGCFTRFTTTKINKRVLDPFSKATSEVPRVIFTDILDALGKSRQFFFEPIAF
jgi:ATP-dependent Zn protease